MYAVSNTRCQVTRVAKFSVVALNICWLSVCNLLHVTDLAPRFLEKFCTCVLCYGLIINTVVGILVPFWHYVCKWWWYMYMSSYAEMWNVSWLWYVTFMKQQFVITHTICQTAILHYKTVGLQRLLSKCFIPKKLLLLVFSSKHNKCWSVKDLSGIFCVL
jgi:hypothetical protein